MVCHITLNEPTYNPRLLRAALASAERYDTVMIGSISYRGRDLVDEYKGIPVQYVANRTRGLPKNTFFWTIKYIEFFIRLCLKARRCRADIIHSHELISLPSALLAAWGRKTKVIYDAYELYCEQGKPQDRQSAHFHIWKWLERRLIRKADAVIAANEERGVIMRERFNLVEDPVAVDNMSEHVERIESDLLRQYVADRGGPTEAIVYYQGMINNNRGVPQLIAAMADVPPGISMVLMGPEHEPIVHEAIAKYGVADRVFYHEPVPSEEVHAWSCSADVGVVIYRNTGLNNYLCAPNKLYQYLMSGIPVLGPDSPTIRKVVAEYHVGALCDPESPQSIAQAITNLLGDKQSLAEARANIPKALAVFNWDEQKTRLMALYERLVGAQ